MIKLIKQLSEEKFNKFIEHVKHYYSWDIILQNNKITGVSDKGDQYEITCPFHEDKRPSMRLNKVTGVYHCFSCGRKGTYTRFLWELAGKQVPYVDYCDGILKANLSLQKELKFSSIFSDEKTLAKEFESRRKFNPNEINSSQMPYSVLASKVRKMGDTWENLVLSLTLLQSNIPSASIIAIINKNQIKINKQEERLGLMDLLN